MTYAAAKLWALVALQHQRARLDTYEERQANRALSRPFGIAAEGEPTKEGLTAAWGALRALARSMEAEGSHSDAAHAAEAMAALEERHGPLNPLAPYMETDR